jgi:hypothetical protein
VNDNTAPQGGGVLLQGTLILQPRASISGNTATIRGVASALTNRPWAQPSSSGASASRTTIRTTFSRAASRCRY